MAKKSALAAMIFGGFATAIAAGANFHTDLLRTGDIVFVKAGKSSFSDAITESTSKDTISYVHVAIISKNEESGETEVIEASPEEGVRSLSWEKFIEDGADFTVKRLQIEFDATEAIARARTYVGQPYDWYYLPDNGMMYCSELVYEAYRDKDGAPIFVARPMRFRAPDGSMPQFWTDLYKKLGVGVPEGIPGTNPNDMAADPRLTDIADTTD